MSKLKLTMLVCLISIINVWAQNPVLHLKYNESSGTSSTIDAISGRTFNIPTNFGKPERVPGIEGNALRTDGYSTWADGIFNNNLGSQVTVETWVSLESYPSDLEKPYHELTHSAIISQDHGDLGFEIGINTFGIYWFSANINGSRYTCQASNPFPLYEWAHVAGVIDGNNGRMGLFLNGQEVASVGIPGGGQLQEAGFDIPFVVGKSNHNLVAGPFLINALSGAFDQTKVYASARTQTALASAYNNGVASARTTGFQAIAVSPLRFQNEISRPTYHAMPPANWTNEPHGLVYHDGQYHMFYQRTPNGPYKYQMHWGHMVSSDLVHWTHLKDALWPTLDWSPTSGYDMKGIWSGDVVVDNGVAHAFYTNVNHTGPFNPGIAHASSNNPNFENWTKHGPVIDKPGDVGDFRDPYIWKDGGVWKMIIGAGINGHGGLDYYTSTNLNNWTRQGSFAAPGYDAMDASIGSGIWEMPVFESVGNGKHILIVNPIGGQVSKHGAGNGKFTRGVYWIGTWNGSQFFPEYTTPKKLDLVHGHLSPSVTRKPNGQLVGIGIVDERRSAEAQRDAGYAHTFSLPRVYSLMPDGKTLRQEPDPALKKLRIGASQTVSDLNVNGTHTIAARGKKVEIVANIDPNATGSKYGVNFFVSDDRSEITRLWYNVSTNKIVLDKRNSSKANYNEWEEMAEFSVDYDAAVFGKPKKIHIFLDNSIIDVFINDAAALSNRMYPTMANSDRIELFSEGTTMFTSVSVWGASPTAEVQGLISGATYTIKSRHSGKVIEVGGASSTNGANIQQWSDIGYDHQRWVVTHLSDGQYSLTAKHNGKAMDLATGSMQNGGNIHLWDYNSSSLNQRWIIQTAEEGHYKIISARSGKALDVASGSTSNGGNIQQWDYEGNSNQEWIFEQVSPGIVSGGTYTIKSRHSGKVLEVDGASSTNGANIQQWTDIGYDHQRWIVTHLGNGQYSITAKHNGKALDLAAGSTSNGGNIQQWSYFSANPNQRWIIEPTSGGYFKVISVHSGKALDLADGSTTNGGNIHQWEYVGGNNQQWAFERVGNSVHIMETNDDENKLKLVGKPEEVLMFPNPATNKITIKLVGESAKIEILNIIGVTVYNGNADQQVFTISTTSLPEGMYIVRIQEDGEIPVLQKMLIRR